MSRRASGLDPVDLTEELAGKTPIRPAIPGEMRWVKFHKLSARNRLKGKIVQVTKGAITCQVKIDVGGTIVTSSIRVASARAVLKAQNRMWWRFRGLLSIAFWKPISWPRPKR
jgi:molybdopterin-binding protein